MTKHDYKQNAYYMLYLIRCVLHNRIPAKEKLDEMDLQQLYEVAQEHSLTAITAYALESAGVYDEAFKQAKSKAIRKNIILDIERQKVISEFEKAGIWYCPLKGCIIKEWYPRIGMRQMADNDILCDEHKMDKVKEVMERCGFTTKVYNLTHQDVYQKPPVCNFEIHSCLLEPKNGDTLYNYYLNIKSKLLCDDNTERGYHMCDEDYYIYIIVHEYKHFAEAGIGLRALVDTYVMNHHYGNDLDRKYISNELDKLGITYFEHENRQLAETLFEGKTLTEADRNILDKYIFSGTYGNFTTRMDIADIDSGIGSKIKYAVDRLKISELELKEYYPFFYKHNSLRWVVYTKRLINKAIYGTDALKKEIGDLLKYRTTSKNTFKLRLIHIADKFAGTPFGKMAKKCYDIIILSEYAVLSAIWRVKSKSVLCDNARQSVVRNVTFIYKSFERQDMAKRLFRSIQKYYPGASVIIADDSKKPLVIKSKYVKIVHLPFNSGLSYGLNRALAEVKTPFTFRMDDDELLTPLSKIDEQLRFLEAHKEIDLVGIQACSAPFPKKPRQLAKTYVRFDMHNAPKPLIIPHMTKIDKDHYVVGKISNIFLVRTDKYKQIGYDDNIKRIDHHEFFYRAAGNIVSAMDTSAFVFHYHNWFDRNYTNYRNETSADAKYIRKKHGDRY